jgi:hypothetical protein
MRASRFPMASLASFKPRPANRTKDLDNVYLLLSSRGENNINLSLLFFSSASVAALGRLVTRPAIFTRSYSIQIDSFSAVAAGSLSLRSEGG